MKQQQTPPLCRLCRETEERLLIWWERGGGERMCEFVIGGEPHREAAAAIISPEQPVGRHNTRNHFFGEKNCKTEI